MNRLALASPGRCPAGYTRPAMNYNNQANQGFVVSTKTASFRYHPDALLEERLIDVL